MFFFFFKGCWSLVFLNGCQDSCFYFKSTPFWERRQSQWMKRSMTPLATPSSTPLQEKRRSPWYLKEKSKMIQLRYDKGYDRSQPFFFFPKTKDQRNRWFSKASPGEGPSEPGEGLRMAIICCDWMPCESARGAAWFPAWFF